MHCMVAGLEVDQSGASTLVSATQKQPYPPMTCHWQPAPGEYAGPPAAHNHESWLLGTMENQCSFMRKTMCSNTITHKFDLSAGIRSPHQQQPVALRMPPAADGPSRRHSQTYADGGGS